MPPSSQAVPAAAADHVTFAAHDIAGVEVSYVRSGFDDLPGELMSDGHGNGDSALRPFVPVVNVEIGSANAGSAHADQDGVDADGGDRDFFQPESRLRFAFYECFHGNKTAPVPAAIAYDSRALGA